MNFERILLLLSVLEKATGYPNLKPISDAAGAELNAIITRPWAGPATPTAETIFPKDSGVIETRNTERKI